MAGKIVFNARRARLVLSANMGRIVSLQEVADAIGVDQRTLMAFELGRTERLEIPLLLGLSRYYHERGIVIPLIAFDPADDDAADDAADQAPRMLAAV